MTRVTNIGIKRTYLQAGFDEENAAASSSAPKPESVILNATQGNSNADITTVPPKKKRKRTPKSKRDGYAAQRAAEALARGEVVEPASATATSETAEPSAGAAGPTESSKGGKGTNVSKAAKKNKKNREKRAKALTASETRRQKRIEQKLVETTCFACREKGHAARDCPTARTEVGDDSEDAEGNGKGKSKAIVGICYRCGSKKHSLSRCKKPADPADPYPYASCFVCNGKGHLASACPQNKAKGVYPNGGCCKLCGDTSPLARDCGIRKTATDSLSLIGMGRETGADEDDFHVIKRTTRGVESDEKQAERMKEMLVIKAGAYTGTVKAYGNVPLPVKKKVVVFK